MKSDYRYSSVMIMRGGSKYKIIGVWDYKTERFDFDSILSIKKDGMEVSQDIATKEKVAILTVAMKEYQSRQWGGGNWL